jgi:hypothetical protein
VVVGGSRAEGEILRAIANALTGLVALSHLGFLVLEMFFWDHPVGRRIFGTLLHRSEEFRKLHYFAVPRWTGVVQSHEAAALRRVPRGSPRDLDLEVDRRALAEYARVYGEA